MPKKRNTSWCRSKKEKQIITARLIEISLKVEDYIYKQKLISVREAEQFIREVSSYKVQCCRDDRSLQVIEKLTRCMRAIISDHQELITGNHTINNDCSITGGAVRAASISPVYSIPDEDRTQFTQIDEEANNNLEIIDLSNVDDDDNVTNTVTGEYAGSRVTVEVDIHKGISSLSLIDVDEPNNMATSTEVNCSQSILNNFEGVENMQKNDLNITSQRSVGLADNITSNKKTANVMQAIGSNSMDKIPEKKIAPMIEHNKSVKLAFIPKKPIFTCNTTNNLKFNTFVQNKEPLKIPNATNYRQTNTFNQNNSTIQTIFRATNNVPENQRQTWYDSNRTCTITDSSHMLTDPKHFTQTRQIYKDVIDVNQVTVSKAGTVNVNNSAENDKQAIATGNSRKPPLNKGLVTNTAVVQENTVTTKKKRGAKKKLTDEKEIKTKNKRVYRRNPKVNKENTLTNTNKNKTVPIYNENVVDDLSWVENIRYVREIKIDENDPTFNFEESFWDNYYLPANWSENEFL